MKIKISEKNIEKIQAALDKANGKATQHTFDTRGVLGEIERIEAALAYLPKCEWVGVQAFCESGQKLPNAYKYPRLITRVTIERFASGWFLTSAVCTKSGNHEGKPTVIMSQSQSDSIALNMRRANGIVIRNPKFEE